jgi:hypothetical protein
MDNLLSAYPSLEQDGAESTEDAAPPKYLTTVTPSR